MTKQKNHVHPVWEVYDEIRTARLNVKYYSNKLSSLQRYNFWIEFFIAFFSSSTIAGLWLWKTELGQLFMKSFAVIPAMLSIIKPLLKLTERMAQLEKLVIGYCDLENDLNCIATQIKHSKTYSSQHKKCLFETLKKKRVLITGFLDPKINNSLVKRLADSVNKELPPDSFFIPDE